MTTRQASPRWSRRRRPPWLRTGLSTRPGWSKRRAAPAGRPFSFSRDHMTDDLHILRTETEAALAAAADLRAWDAVRVGVLGKSGKLTGLLKELGMAPPEQRRERGAA